MAKLPEKNKFDPNSLDDAAAPLKGKVDGKKEMQRLAKALERKGLVDGDMIKAAFASGMADESAASLKSALIHMNVVSEEDMLDAMAADMGMKRIRLSEVSFNDQLLDEMTPEQVRKYRVVPVKATADELWIALADPQNVRLIDDLSRILGKHINGMISTEDEIDKAIRTFYEQDEYREMYEEVAENEDPGNQSQYTDQELDILDQNPDDTKAVVKYVDLLFRQAVHMRASDVHFEPTRTGMVIRLRVDGVLQEVPPPPLHWRNEIISRLKVLANLDLAEKRIPLDGRIKLRLPDKKLDLRVSSLPTLYGESIVIRILDQGNVLMGLEDVGFLPDTTRLFYNLIRSPNGIILMTGPTGSGKTTTLYAALGTLNTPEHKLMTLEDPIEYQIAGINQVQINNEIGLTFPVGLRGLLRQSPDVILVGEIRDLETAEYAIRAALTGHLVFSTLHTNDACSATIRLVDMGVKPYMVASSLQAVLAQRLARRICSNCKRAYMPGPEEFVLIGYNPEEYEGVELFKGEGCERCGKSGYRGRIAIHEVLTLDPELRRRIVRSEPSTRLKRYAMTKGMRTLRMDGFEKSLLGYTTIASVVDMVGGED